MMAPNRILPDGGEVASLIVRAGSVSQQVSDIDVENETKPKTFKQHKELLLKRFKTERPGLRLLPALALLVMGVLFIIAGPVYRVFALSMSTKNKDRYVNLFLTENGVASRACPPPSSPSSTYVEITLGIIQLIAAQASLRVVGDFHAYGGLAADTGNNLLNVGSNQRLYISVEKAKASYGYGEVLGKKEVIEFMDYANPFSSYTFYPMDKYIAATSISAYIETTVNTTTTVTSPVALCVRYKNRLSSFQSKSTIKYAGLMEIPGNGHIALVMTDIKFSRTPATQFFSLFICILMWCLSTFQLVIAIDHLFLRPREPPPPTVGFSVALLFALPTVRNTQPEVPPIGVVVDLLGFFWNICSVAIGAVMFMAAFVGYHRHTPMK